LRLKLLIGALDEPNPTLQLILCALKLKDDAPGFIVGFFQFNNHLLESHIFFFILRLLKLVFIELFVELVYLFVEIS
jgi:hypothetical protein